MPELSTHEWVWLVFYAFKAIVFGVVSVGLALHLWRERQERASVRYGRG